jgi:predicted FMN-binding regulatory protein PaiB
VKIYMKRFSKFFCVAILAIVFLGICISAHAETCTPANPVVSVTAQLIPATCTVKSCPKYCYTAEFIKQIFEDLDEDSALTSYAKNTTTIDSRPHYDWSFDNATIPDLNGIIGSYINQVQDSCRKNDGTTPTDKATYNACVAAYQDLLSSWSSLQGNSLKQDTTFDNSKIVKQLRSDVNAIVKNNFTGLIPTNPINTDNKPTVAATTQGDNSDCNDDNPNFISCVSNLPLCLFRYINIGVIHLTTWIIKIGVNTMGWLMQPHNLWGGISNNPAVVQAFGASVSVVNIAFSIVLILMAIGTILNLKNYKINDLITKFIIVALLINFTLVIAGSVLDLANYLSLYFFNATLKSIQSGDVASKWTEILTNHVCLSGVVSSVGRMFASIFINLSALIAITWALFSMCGSLLKRGLMLIFLLILSPFAVICYLLPEKGMGKWWGKWKEEFLKQAFYGVYVSIGFYLGTIMLSALAINPSQSADPDLSFISGLIKPILAAGYLVYIVLLADEVAGGSAKATAEGAAKVALGLAAGGLAAGATGIATKIGTSKQVSELATNLSKRGGLSAALGTRLSSFNKTSQGKAQESRKAVEAKLANENPDSYKDKVDNLLVRAGSGENLNSRDQQFLAAALNKLPDKQRKALSADAQAAIPTFTDSMFKAGVLSKPEQKDINGTVPVRAAQFKAKSDYDKANKALTAATKEGNADKIKKAVQDKKAAITDNVSDIINTFRRYRESDPNRKDDIIQSVKDLKSILTFKNDKGESLPIEDKPLYDNLTNSIYKGLLTSNDPQSVCTMFDEILKTDSLDDSDLKTFFMEHMAERLAKDPTNAQQAKKIMREAIKVRHNATIAETLEANGIPRPKGKGANGEYYDEDSDDNSPPDNSNNENGE